MIELLIPFALVLLGFAVLIAGGEILVRGASGLAVAMRISPLVIGLTVVAFCTSAPELAVSLQSCLKGEVDLAVGNIVGSCICNILLILGLTALIRPLEVQTKLVRFEVPLMIGIAVLTWILGLNGMIGRIEGALMFVGLIAYLAWAIFQSKREGKEAAIAREKLADLAELVETRPSPGKVFLYILFLGIGLAMLIFGSDWLVRGAVEIARRLNVSELMIGLTVLALGTSLPELAVSIVAGMRGNRDMAVGNVVGSNIFNLLGVLGPTAALAPGGVPVSFTAVAVDIPVMIVVCALCFPIFFTGYKISRAEGLFFLFCYVAYIGYLIMTSQVPPAQG